MILNVTERLLAIGMLPAEGSYATLKIIREAKEALSFGEDEMTSLGMVFDEEKGSFSWKGDVERDIELGPTPSMVIAKALEKLDKEEKLTEKHLSLYQKFVPGDKE